MYYFQFFIDESPLNSLSRKERVARLQQLAVVNYCSCDVEDHESYSTVRVETPNKENANLFRCSAERPLDEGAYQNDGFDSLR